MSCTLEQCIEAREDPENVEDLIRLNDLNEGSLLWTLRERYSEEVPAIYVRTLCGCFIPTFLSPTSLFVESSPTVLRSFVLIGPGARCWPPRCFCRHSFHLVYFAHRYRHISGPW